MVSSQDDIDIVELMGKHCLSPRPVRRNNASKISRPICAMSNIMAKLTHRKSYKEGSPTCINESNDSRELYIVLRNECYPESTGMVGCNSKRHMATNSHYKKHSLQQHLLHACKNVNNVGTIGKVKTSSGCLQNGSFTASLYLIDFPTDGDIIAQIKPGVCEFFSVEKISKKLNKKNKLNSNAKLQAVFCNLIYFPCYIETSSIQLNFVSKTEISFVGKF